MTTDPDAIVLKVFRAAIRATPVFGGLCVLAGLTGLVFAASDPMDELAAPLRLFVGISGVILALTGLVYWKYVPKKFARILAAGHAAQEKQTENIAEPAARGDGVPPPQP